MVPLELDSEVAMPEKTRILNWREKPFSGTIADTTRTIDAAASVDIVYEGSNRKINVESWGKHRNPTSYNPLWRIPKKDVPGPGAYDAKYNMPRVKQVHLPSRNATRKLKKRKVGASNLIDIYCSNLRNFDSVYECEDTVYYDTEPSPKPLKPSVWTHGRSERDSFLRKTPASQLSAYDIPEPTPPRVAEFKRQMSREFEVVADVGRIYEKALEQELKLRKRTPNALRFQEQSGRKLLGEPSVNTRNQLLDEIAEEQSEYVRNVTGKSRMRKERPSPRKMSTFDQQRSRSAMLYSNVTEDMGMKSELPFDPISSYKNTIPQARKVQILGTREVSAQKFWTIRR
jgi:hypothetical protein